jgi:CheY-like chemotaxis protein/MinD-like ATPase involved in chromosome partitioning or flagellar assembly
VGVTQVHDFSSQLQPEKRGEVMESKILIVDDQAMMLKLIGHTLQQDGYNIVTAMTGAEALQKIQSEQPELVILDLMLPDMSGIDVCHRIRQVLHLTDLPIIILSGQTELSAKIQGLEAGADEYVTKPVDPKEMAARVKSLLARTQRLRQVMVAPATQRSRQGKIVAVIGAKGGVGTTTVVANLVTGLLMRNYKSIAVELRPYFGTLARHFGIQPTSTLNDLLELTAKAINEQQISARLQSNSNGVQLLAGPQQLKGYREAQAEQVEALLKCLVHMTEYVVVDLPHMPSVANRSTLRAAHTIVIVVEPEASCVASAQALIELLQAWTISPTIIKLVSVNRIQSVQTISAAELERSIDCELLGTVTAAPDMAVVALNMGTPMMSYAPTSLVAGTLQDVVGRLIATKTVSIR